MVSPLFCESPTTQIRRRLLTGTSFLPKKGRPKTINAEYLMIEGTITIEYKYNEKNPSGSEVAISDTNNFDGKKLIEILTLIISSLDDIQE